MSDIDDLSLFERFPKVGLLTARFITGFPASELILSRALSKLIGGAIGYAVTVAIFHQIRNISDRLEAFKDILEEMPNAPHRDELLSLTCALKELNGFRNILAHGHWRLNTFHDLPRLEVQTWMTAKRRKSEGIEMTEALLQENLDALNKTNKRLLEVVRELGGQKSSP